MAVIKDLDKYLFITTEEELAERSVLRLNNSKSILGEGYDAVVIPGRGGDTNTEARNLVDSSSNFQRQFMPMGRNCFLDLPSL